MPLEFQHGGDIQLQISMRHFRINVEPSLQNLGKYLVVNVVVNMISTVTKTKVICNNHDC